MYSTNSQRNRLIYELWERGGTVMEISSTTGIPRGTVGYYVRKFNKLAEKGKPIVFPSSSYNPETLTSYNAQEATRALMYTLEQRILESVGKSGDWQGIYYRLSSFKLLKELGLLTMSGQANFLSLFASWLDYQKNDANFDQMRKIKDALDRMHG